MKDSVSWYPPPTKLLKEILRQQKSEFLSIFGITPDNLFFFFFKKTWQLNCLLDPKLDFVSQNRHEPADKSNKNKKTERKNKKGWMAQKAQKNGYNGQDKKSFGPAQTRL